MDPPPPLYSFSQISNFSFFHTISFPIFFRKVIESGKQLFLYNCVQALSFCFVRKNSFSQFSHNFHIISSFGSCGRGPFLGFKDQNCSLVFYTAKCLWDSSMFSSIKPKLDIGLLVDLAEFPCFVPDLAWCDHKIVLFWSAERYYDNIMQKRAKTQKSTNNPMSIFGFIEQNMELSHIL